MQGHDDGMRGEGERETDKERLQVEADKRRAFEEALERGDELVAQAMMLLQDMANKGSGIRV